MAGRSQLSAYRRHLQFEFWKKYFRDPSKWWDNRSRKTSSHSPVLKHKITKESLWADGVCNPSWIREEVAREGLAGLAEIRDAELNWKFGKGNEQNIVALLKACAKQKDEYTGVSLHADILKSGLLGKSPYVASTLVSMYAKCGALVKAQRVLDELPVRDVVIWNALIAGYTQHGHGEKALYCFEEMQHEGIHPNVITFACILKACGNMGAGDKGKKIHDEIVKQGLLGTNVMLDNALVDMYARCGAVAKAHQVFEELPIRNVSTWNSLIFGYVQQGHGEDALNCFEQLQREGFCPNAITFACVLKACSSIRAIDKGKEIHDEIVKQGLLGTDIVLGNTLVDMYAKCSAFAKAQQVLDELPLQNIVSWNALISGYTQYGHGREALDCYERLQCKGLTPNGVTYTCILKACASLGAIDKGKQIHDEIVGQGLLEIDSVLGNALVEMYAKCGILAKAAQVLHELPVRNVVSWSILISGYAQHGHGEEALNCFEQMQHEGLHPNAVTFTCILKACGNVGAVNKGKQIHDEIVKKCLLGTDIVLGNSLVDMYVKCGALTKAQEVLDELPARDIVTWSTLIAGYAQNGHGEEALKCYEQMRCEGLCANEVTFACILKACGIVGLVDKGKEVHDEIVRQRLLGTNIVLDNALVDMYAKCGALTKAQEVLDELPTRNVVTWNALIDGYVQHFHGEEAINCFERMQREGLCPNEVTFACILKACGSIGATDKGKQIHGEIGRQGLLETDIIVGNALVDMYAKCGVLAKARQVLDELPNRNVVSWSALIGGYVQHGHAEEALDCFERMQQEGVCPNAVTFASILKACGCVGAACKGKQIHDEIVRQGLLETNCLVLGTALVDMYAKCGMLAKAQLLLDELPVWNVATWNALIAGYALQGRSDKALKCFQQMQHKGLCPDAVTISCVLNACSHSGLLDEGQMYFANMSTSYGVIPEFEHYTCMVDLFGRAGHFNKAIQVIKKMPSPNYLPVWAALLGACRKWGNVKLGRLAFEHITHLDKTHAAAYVCMSNIYAAAGMQEDAEKIESMRVQNEAWKKPGCSWWSDGEGIVHSFSVGDTKHAQNKYIYAKLQDLTDKMSQEGYSPSLHWVSQNIPDGAKEDVLCGHSEKLAIACALINTPSKEPVTVVKNLRICGDCHAATSFISKIEKRKITVRDANRFHVFEGGKCSCEDYS